MSPSAPTELGSSRKVCHNRSYSARQSGTPTRTPSLLRSSTQEQPFTTGTSAGKNADKMLRSRRPPASDFNNQNHQTRSGSTPNKFWISPFLSTFCHGNNHSLVVGCTSPGAIAMQGTHQCRVHRQLGPSEQWQPVHCHFESASIGCDGCVEVQDATARLCSCDHQPLCRYGPPHSPEQTPPRAQARWWPRTSSGRPHRQERTVKRRGS